MGLSSERSTTIRFAELVALLSLGTDLGLGQPMEHMIRACLIALRLADQVGVPESERRVLYYSGLLAWVGCHTDAYEQAKWLGDDLASKSDAHYGYDFGRVRQATSFLLKHLGGASRPLLQRAQAGLGFLGEGRRALESLAQNHYLATDELALRLGLGEDVRASLRQSYERWDGKGPLGLAGQDVLVSARLVSLADVVEVFRRTGGIEAAIAVARERSGTQFDPALVAIFCQHAPTLLGDRGSAASWDALIAAEPSLAPLISDEGLDDALDAVGAFAELKSPWMLGHARTVADLVGAAGRTLGLPESELVALRRAALVHDLGSLGVSNAIWDRRGPLGPAEWERVRLHPYLGERMLAFSTALAPLGALVGQHHERLDGSGYPRGLTGPAISPASRLLAAADVYAALIEPRPHRSALSPEQAATELAAEVVAGRIDGEAAGAVLSAAGHRHRNGQRRDWPGGLTAREVEVLRLLARGSSNKEIAAELGIASKTVGNHVEHIYAKIAATNRAGASLYAMKHGLMTGS